MTVEDRFKFFESSDVITSKLEQIIDAFVAYYGEDRRKEITNKFKNILILKFSNVASYRYNIDKIPETLFKEIFNVPQRELLYLTVEDYDRLCKYLENDTEDEEYDVDPSMLEIITGSPNSELHYNYHKGAYPKLEEFIKKYKELRPRLTPYIEYAKNEFRKMSQIEDKYYKMLFEEFKDIFNEEDIIDYESTGIPSYNIMALLGPSINADGNCFDSDSEKRLHDPYAPMWAKNSIIIDRTKLLDALYKPQDGQTHSNYHSYLKDPKCVEFIEKLKVVSEQISQREKELYQQMIIEQVESLDDYKKNRAEINKMNFLDKNDALGVYTYFGRCCCLDYNFIKTPNGIIAHPIMMINSKFDELDEAIIHEFNHALEYHILEMNGNAYHDITGWDEGMHIINDKENRGDALDDNEYRKYELISEYVNDRLAEEITTLMHAQGHYIFDMNDTSIASYQQEKPLLEPFYQEFKEIIIKSRSNGNIDYLFDQIGKENFDELNDLTNTFHDKFRGGLESVNRDIKRNKKTEDTTLYLNIMTKRDEILAKMREYLHKKSL